MVCLHGRETEGLGNHPQTSPLQQKKLPCLTRYRIATNLLVAREEVILGRGCPFGMSCHTMSCHTPYVSIFRLCRWFPSHRNSSEREAERLPARLSSSRPTTPLAFSKLFHRQSERTFGNFGRLRDLRRQKEGKKRVETKNVVKLALPDRMQPRETIDV